MSYLNSLERDGQEWTHTVLMNPRSGTLLRVKFDSLIHLFSAGKSKLDLVEQFVSLVDRRRTHAQ